MQTELQVIADILALLERDLESDAARHDMAISETAQQE
jgi:hypothetical protein